ncbi:MAG: AmmeMemoRadiSam system radical SAM enzyme [Candidatus Krumholzibacteriia bacterium]
MKVPAAAYWEPRPDQAVACLLCPTACTVREGRDGPCGTRGNRGGRMVPLRYAQVAAAGLDPMEKKPLYHFLPGSPILSVAAAGCNLHCQFCQNWRLSQEPQPLAESLSPQAVVDLARRHRSVGIAYTYSEPLVWFEFVRDTTRLARAAGLANVIVSNGYLNPAPLAELFPWLDAANIDLKSMDERFYRDICKGHLEPVLASLAALHRAGVHLEVTNLVIPGHNDSDEQLRRLRDHVADVSPAIPLHLSAYRPAWCFDAPATPAATLAHAAEICAERLDFVYTGNVDLPRWNDTRCPGCGTVVIARAGGQVTCDLARPRCPGCDRTLPLVLELGPDREAAT